MAEETAAQEGKSQSTEAEKVAERAEKPDAVRKALQAERDARKAAEKRANELAAKVEEFESKGKSEIERLTDKLTKAEEARKGAEAKLLRFEVATAKQIPGDAVDLLSGSTREELEASADKLLGLMKKAEKPPEFDGGAREEAADTRPPEEQHNDFILSALGLKPNQ